jgi:nucleoid-associated protein YgaU
MHRDVKIGLILGVLLVGLVAALFFRRERDEGPGLAEPARSEPSSEEDTLVQLEPPLKLEEVPSAAKAEDAETSQGPAVNLIDPQGDSLASRATVVPRPLEGLVQPLPGRTFPRLGARTDADRAGDATSQPAAPVAPAPTSSPTRHRIASGDTLWDLAVRYLGDGSRSDEIYRANRSVLSSPDVLPVGKEIVIPAKTASSVRRTTPPPTALAQRPSIVTRRPTAVARRPTAATQQPAPARLQAPPVVLQSRPDVRRSTAPSRRSTSTAGNAKQYTVRDGDTLYSIARKIYNDASRWIDIYRANRSVLSDPDALKSGLTLRLPR